ncbi:MAG: helicase [Actinomycetia bacterium]|nr:helicase [Actinomycetes bacterium]
MNRPPAGSQRVCTRWLRAVPLRRRDRGSGTVLVLAVMGVVWMVAYACMVAGGVRVARQRAHAAADQAALAAAAYGLEGPSAACARATAIAHGMGAVLSGCALVPDPAAVAGSGQIADVTVTTAYPGPAWVGTLRIPARARAGPVSSSGPGPAVRTGPA